MTTYVVAALVVGEQHPERTKECVTLQAAIRAARAMADDLSPVNPTDTEPRDDGMPYWPDGRPVWCGSLYWTKHPDIDGVPIGGYDCPPAVPGGDTHAVVIYRRS